MSGMCVSNMSHLKINIAGTLSGQCRVWSERSLDVPTTIATIYTNPSSILQQSYFHLTMTKFPVCVTLHIFSLQTTHRTSCALIKHAMCNLSTCLKHI